MVQVDLLKIDVRTPDLQGDQRTGENADERAPFEGKCPRHTSTAIINRLGVRAGALQGGDPKSAQTNLIMETGRRCQIRDGPTLGAVVLEHLLRGRDGMLAGGQSNKTTNQPTLNPKDEDWVGYHLTLTTASFAEAQHGESVDAGNSNVPFAAAH